MKAELTPIEAAYALYDAWEKEMEAYFEELGLCSVWESASILHPHIYGLISKRQWRDIETAPKDETVILITGGTYDSDSQINGFKHNIVSPARYITVVNPGIDSNWRSFNYGIWNPTRWQPLPQPPEVTP